MPDPGPEMMTCAKRPLRLTTAGCARLWLSARDDRPNPNEGRHACLACPVGAAHAGQPFDAGAELREALRPICIRCGRSGRRLINHRHCVSCYNRQREADRGRNARGTTPRLIAQLRPIALTVIAESGEARTVEQTAVVAAELVLATLKDARGTVVFGPARTIMEAA